MEWISVKDRLPEYGGRILIAVHGTNNEGMREESGVFFAVYKCGEFHVIVDDAPLQNFRLYFSMKTSIYTDWGMRYDITHWMPLPELPEEVTNNENHS